MTLEGECEFTVMEHILGVIVIIVGLYILFRYLMAAAESANHFRNDYRHPNTRKKDLKSYQTISLVFFIIFTIFFLILLFS